MVLRIRTWSVDHVAACGATESDQAHFEVSFRRKVYNSPSPPVTALSRATASTSSSSTCSRSRTRIEAADAFTSTQVRPTGVKVGDKVEQDIGEPLLAVERNTVQHGGISFASQPTSNRRIFAQIESAAPDERADTLNRPPRSGGRIHREEHPDGVRGCASIPRWKKAVRSLVADWPLSFT